MRKRFKKGDYIQFMLKNGQQLFPPPSERDKVLGAIEVLNKCDVEYSIHYDGCTYVRNAQSVRCTATADDINELRKLYERLHDGE